MPWKIGIIGMGPRGLALLDRISNAFSVVNFEVEIHVFEPRELGCGVHSSTQPRYLLTNTVCSQITAFGPVVNSSLRPIGRPSLFEWARARGYEVTDSGNVRRMAHENDYLPRAVLGQYLAWAYQYIVRNLPKGAAVVHHRSAAVALDQVEASLEIASDDGIRVCVDSVFVCTGHAVDRSEELYAAQPGSCRWPYPVEETIESLPDGHRIGVEGLGLTALDVVSAATIGRGGEFTRDGQELVYHPSGRELQIVCFSRSGVPLCARARNQKGTHWNYQPHFVSTHNIDRIRRNKLASDQQCKGQLDFELDVLPLIKAEMELVYYTALIRRTSGPGEAESFAEQCVVLGPGSEKVQEYIARIPEALRFSFSSLIATVPASIAASDAEYRTWLISRMKDDIAEARLGNVDSPIKAACDVLRDVRPILRYAVDLAGLTSESHRFFLEDFVPLMNRLSVGPPLQKLEEFCALINVGIIDVGLGPIEGVRSSTDGHYMLRGTAGEREVDVLISARIPLTDTGSKVPGIVQTMIKSGLAQPFRNGDFSPGGIAVTNTYRVIPKDGKRPARIWALGTPVEGARFYTFVLSVPGAPTSPLTEAQACIDDMMRTAVRFSSSLVSENDDVEVNALMARASAA